MNLIEIFDTAMYNCHWNKYFQFCNHIRSHCYTHTHTDIFCTRNIIQNFDWTFIYRCSMATHLNKPNVYYPMLYLEGRVWDFKIIKTILFCNRIIFVVPILPEKINLALTNCNCWKFNITVFWILHLYYWILQTNKQINIM